MGQLEAKKFVRIQLENKKINELELNVNSNLDITRKKLKKLINFPFIFTDGENNEISIDDEFSSTLNDVLDGKNLYIKKRLKPREVLGEKLYSKNGLNFYLYPKANLLENKEKEAFTIMIIGETGVGKSTWIHSLLNYLEGIEIDENIRYLLFDEQQKQKEYEIKYGKKSLGSSVTDIPEIYQVGPTKLFDNQLQIIDTTGFGDTRGIDYDSKIIEDIHNLLEISKIEKINAICLIFKANETRAHDRLRYLLDKLFSLFGKDVKNNFIIIFTFVDSLSYIPIKDVLKNENLSFYKIFGDIKNLPTFYFNNKAYFESDKNFYYNMYEKNTINFQDFFYYLSYLRPSSLDITKKILKKRIKIRRRITEIYINSNHIISEISSFFNENKILNDKKKSILEHINSPYVLYCKYHNNICHKNCKGSKLCSHFCYNNRCNLCNCNNSEHRYIMIYDYKREKEYNINLIKEINMNDGESTKTINRLYHFLMNSIETLLNLILKNIEINDISLKKDDVNIKNEYIQNTLNEIVKRRNKITDFLKEILPNLENIDHKGKEDIIYNFINKLGCEEVI